MPDFEVEFVARGIRFFEPAFAALVAAPGRVAHGVLYDVTETEWARLCAREAGYFPVGVLAETNGETHRAIALAICDAERLPEPRRPSRRYVRILLEGAREHALPAEWIARLEELEWRGPSLTTRFSLLMKAVVALIPYLGPSGAIAVTVLVGLGGVIAAVWVVIWTIDKAIL